MVETKRRPLLKPLIFLTLSFFIWGCLTSINSTLVPYFKQLFNLSYQKSMLVNVSFYLAPLVSCIPCSSLISRKGYRFTLRTAIGFALIGCALLYIAVLMLSFTLTLLAIFVIAIGVASMQVVANPFVTLLGDAHSAAGRLTLASAINSMGTTLSPIIVGFALSSTILSDSLQLSQVIAQLYMMAGVFLCIMFLSFSHWHLPDFHLQNQEEKETGRWQTLLQQRHFVVGVLAIFVYVGVEVSLGTMTINYLSAQELGGLSGQQATSLIAIYWGGSLVGRFLFSLTAHKIKAPHALTAVTAIAFLFTLFSVLSGNLFGGIALILVGLMNSLMYPVIFSHSLMNLGKNTGLASAIMIMAGVGGGILPMLQASFADSIGLKLSFIVPMFGYLLLLSYSLIIQKISVYSPQ